MMDDIVRTIMIVGQPEAGILLKFHGETIAPGLAVGVPNNSPAAVIAESCEALKVQSVHGQRFSDMPEGEFSFEIHEQPEN